MYSCPLTLFFLNCSLLPPPADYLLTQPRRTFRTNTLSHYHLTSLFLRPFISRPGGGTLVTISSVLAHVGASRLSDYTASKSALIAFHSSLSAELASTPNIKTMLVTPGKLDTEIFKAVRLGWVQKFFAPVVEVREMAVKLMAMIDSGKGEFWLYRRMRDGSLGWLSSRRACRMFCEVGAGLMKLWAASQVDEKMPLFLLQTTINYQICDTFEFLIFYLKKTRGRS